MAYVFIRNYGIQYGYAAYAQQFIPTEDHTVVAIKVRISSKILASGSHPFTIQPFLHADSAGLPGTALGNAGEHNYPSETLPVTPGGGALPDETIFTLATPVELTANTPYWISLYTSYYTGDNEVRWHYTLPASLPQAAIDDGINWVQIDPPQGTLGTGFDYEPRAQLSATLVGLYLTATAEQSPGIEIITVQSAEPADISTANFLALALMMPQSVEAPDTSIATIGQQIVQLSPASVEGPDVCTLTLRTLALLSPNTVEPPDESAARLDSALMLSQTLAGLSLSATAKQDLNAELSQTMAGLSLFAHVGSDGRLELAQTLAGLSLTATATSELHATLAATLQGLTLVATVKMEARRRLAQII